MVRPEPGPATTLRDDLGHPVAGRWPPRRVVSLVPLLTESVPVTRPGALAGATIWCNHPADLAVPASARHKSPDLAASDRWQVHIGNVTMNTEQFYGEITS